MALVARAVAVIVATLLFLTSETTRRLLSGAVGVLLLIAALAAMKGWQEHDGGTGWTLMFLGCSFAGWTLLRYGARGRQRPPPVQITVNDNRLW